MIGLRGIGKAMCGWDFLNCYDLTNDDTRSELTQLLDLKNAMCKTENHMRVGYLTNC